LDSAIAKQWACVVKDAIENAYPLDVKKFGSSA